MNDTVSTPVSSSNRGRNALDDPQEGRDLTAGKEDSSWRRRWAQQRDQRRLKP